MRKTERKRNSSIKRDYYTIVAGLVFIGTMIFRIPLEHMIGDKGLACYGTAYEIYFVLGGMISYGLSETVSATFRIFHMLALPHSIPDPANSNLHVVCSLIHSSHHKSVFPSSYLSILLYFVLFFLSC